MVLIVGNGGGTTSITSVIEEADNVYIPVDSIITPNIIIVDGEEYDLAGLTSIQILTVKALKLTYENFSVSAREAMPFDVYVYKLTNVTILRNLFVPEEDSSDIWIEEVLDVDFESPAFSFKVWLSDLRLKLKLFFERMQFASPFIIILGVIIVALIGYQYSKSYVSQKAVKRASK